LLETEYITITIRKRKKNTEEPDFGCRWL